MSLLRKCLLGVAIAFGVVAVLFVPLTLGLMAGFPFVLWTDEEKVEPVGASATFEESADCLFQYRHYSTGRDLGGRIDGEEAAFCFPPQTAATRRTLIACFNEYERAHPGDVDWPEGNMQGCTWKRGVTVAVPHGLAFGDVTAVPAVPRAGKRFRLTVAVTGDDSVAADVNTVIKDDTLVTFVALGDGIPVSHEYGAADADGSIYVEFTVPTTTGGSQPEPTEGMRLTISLTLAAHTPTGEKIVTYTVGGG